MFDMEARRVIEALRSGVPSRAVGQYFSEARPQIMKEISDRLERVCETGTSDGFLIAGKYGEGKTHLLNTVFNMAHSNQMVVSYISLSKETPMDKLYLFYQKLIAGTYLPMRRQPGFSQLLDKMTPGNPAVSDLLFYAAKDMQTDKLYFLLRSYMGTEDQEEKFLLKADLEGDFIANTVLKKIYKRIYNQTARFSANFSKTKNVMDYFSFMSRFFVKMGYQGWVILVDEAELMGRLGKKARLKAYENMAPFLFPKQEMQSVFTMFAISASYTEDVIEGKHEYDNLMELYPEQPEPCRSVLDALVEAPQLLPLTKEEIVQVLEGIRRFHGKAYDWDPQVSTDTLLKAAQSGGYLLRTRIRATIELLDQLYQYGQAGDVKVGTLTEGSYEEDVPSLDENI